MMTRLLLGLAAVGALVATAAIFACAGRSAHDPVAIRYDAERAPAPRAPAELPAGVTAVRAAAEPPSPDRAPASKSGDFSGRDDARINRMTRTRDDALSTFAIDVDTAAYSIARRSISSERLPPPTLVRVEEFINFFRYGYDAPTAADQLFAIEATGTRSPVDREKHLLRIGIQARNVGAHARKPVNLVFLVDTSGSMSSRDKLELAQRALTVAVDRLDERDQVAITTYAGGVRLVLPPTSAAHKEEIKRALKRLRSGGGTAMSSGLQLAYEQARAMMTGDEVTRVIVCSDGDANIGSAAPQQILDEVADYVDDGIRLSTIGFGDGNYRDDMMETLANRGNGNYFYVDSMRQAERVFGRDLFKMLEDVAQDVKIQVAFDPERVSAYRLVGYENRAVADDDFRNDEVDAGEIGAGHQVTALYELVLAEGAKGRLGEIRVRAKRPLGTVAKETAFELRRRHVERPFSEGGDDFRFAVAVMAGAELLRSSPYAQGWSYQRIIEIAEGARAPSGQTDPDRTEFIALMSAAHDLAAASVARSR